MNDSCPTNKRPISFTTSRCVSRIAAAASPPTPQLPYQIFIHLTPCFHSIHDLRIGISAVVKTNSARVGICWKCLVSTWFSMRKCKCNLLKIPSGRIFLVKKPSDINGTSHVSHIRIFHSTLWCNDAKLVLKSLKLGYIGFFPTWQVLLVPYLTSVPKIMAGQPIPRNVTTHPEIRVY